jgi:membrane-bound metal-dependent hydrolase YbcI (DUF457 family)
MPSPLAHSLGAYAAIGFANPESVTTPEGRRRTFGIAAIFGCLADVDFLVAQFTRNPVLQHHYFTHSIPFAILVGLISYTILLAMHSNASLKKAGLITLAYMTHLLLDFLTQDGGRPYGIPLLWPFTHQHFVSPVIIFFSIHRGGWNDLFSAHNIIGICIEFLVMFPFAYAAVWRAEHQLKKSQILSSKF